MTINNLEQELQELQKVADIEFRVAYSRNVIGKVFTDTLTLEFSDRMRTSNARKKYANALMSMVCYKPMRQELDYIPANMLMDDDITGRFLKEHDGNIFATELGKVEMFAKGVFDLVDSILAHPYSLAVNISVDGLDYFEAARPSKGRLYLIKGGPDSQLPTFYNTADEGTYRLRNRILTSLKAA